MPRPVRAAMSLEFSGLPTAVQDESEFTLSVSLSDAPVNSTYYLRAAFYKDGTTDYFGYTYNHLGAWTNSTSNHTQFLQITTDSGGSYSGQLKAKADLSSSHFKGGGSYSFKLGRYTQGGSGPTWSGSQSITINAIPTQTPTPSPAPTSIPTPTITPPSVTATLKPAATVKPTTRPTIRPTDVEEEIDASIDNEESQVDIALSATSNIASESATPTPMVLGSTRRRPLLPTILMVLGGLLTLGFGIPLAITEFRNRKSTRS